MIVISLTDALLMVIGLLLVILINVVERRHK